MKDLSIPHPHILEIIYIYIHFSQKNNLCTLKQ